MLTLQLIGLLEINLHLIAVVELILMLSINAPDDKRDKQHTVLSA
jgi:hypothetical protein